MSTLASYGDQQALCLAPQTALDTTDRLQKKIEHHEDSNQMLPTPRSTPL